MSLRNFIFTLLFIFISSFAQAQYHDTTQQKVEQIAAECEKKADFDQIHGSTALIIEANEVNNKCLEEHMFNLINKYYPKPQSVIKKVEQVKKSFFVFSESINFENKYCPRRADCILGLDVITPYSDYGEFLKQQIRRIEVIIYLAQFSQGEIK